MIEFRNGRAIEERQSVKIGECVGDFVILPVDLANPVHAPQTPLIRTFPLGEGPIVTVFHREFGLADSA